MNKAELIDTLAEQTGHTKADIGRILEALLDTIEAAVARGDKLQLLGFGIFERQHRAARTGRNPRPAPPSKSPPRPSQNSRPASPSRTG